MKNRRIQFLSYILLSLLYTLNSIAQEGKSMHALLIGINSYPIENAWEKINGASDVLLLKETLKKLQFQETNITTVLNEQATKQNIQFAFEKLIKSIQINSTIHIHFSGHGQQVADKNFDEKDGYDEALVPYDSPKYYLEGEYEGENLITDDELTEYLMRLRLKAGKHGHLFISIDACHSGTATRGFSNGRGTDQIMASSKYIKKCFHFEHDNKALDAEPKMTSDDIAPIVSVFSSSAYEKSYEITVGANMKFGLMSYSLCKLLSNLENCTSYHDLFEKLKIEIFANTSLQHPQMEGNTELCIYGGIQKSEYKFISIKDIITDHLILIDRGEFHQIFKGSELLIYPENITDTTGIQALAVGVVDETSAFDADVFIKDDISTELLKNAKALLVKSNFGPLTIAVKVSLSDSKINKKIISRLKGLDFIRLTEQHPDLFIETPSSFAANPQLRLYSTDESILLEKPIEELKIDSLIFDISEAIMRYTKAQYLRKLEIPSENIKSNLSIEIKNNNQFIPLKTNVLLVNDTAKIIIKNEGAEGFYLALLDINPEHLYRFMIPKLTESPYDYYLKPGETFIQDIYISPPLGIEFLKLIATKDPLDLSIVETTRGSQNNKTSIISKVVSNAKHLNKNIFSKSILADKNEVLISSYYFEIKN
ncbi:MAG: caspase family protein [Saprospiraceae bacterium]|nr:caspase family protein [Saprospiraceae bacterium]